MEITNNYTKARIDEIKEKGYIPIRFVVYDNVGKLLGYKVDNVWNLDIQLFKIHSFKQSEKKENSLEDLIKILNKKEDFELDEKIKISPIGGIYIVAEEIDEREKVVRPIFGYHIQRGEDKKFK